MSTRIRRRARQGVVLLICLAILVLFMLIGVTFLILSGQYLSGAKRMAKHEIVGDDPQKVTEMAFYQAITGARPALRSSLRGHELLRDMYGVDGVSGQIANAFIDTDTGGQFIRIQIPPALLASNGGAFAIRPGYYNGRVFTMLNGPAAGISTRVVDYAPNAVPPWIQVEMFETDNAALVAAINANANNALLNFKFQINGAAFNGTGFGYIPFNSAILSSGNLNQTDPNFGMPVALMPHFAAYLPNVPDAGGADEGRDAVDYQDMALARNTPDQNIIDPSFHRRALVNYWANYIVNNSIPPAQVEMLARQCVLRPLPFQSQHPNFSGSNPSLNFGGAFDRNNPAHMAQLFNVLTQGPYDVDNDGDGIPDSIWLDLDLPIKTAPDGRRYKPLVAFLIQDQDGRINLNANGSVAHADASYTQQPFGNFAGGVPRNIPLPRGLGFGPADIAFGTPDNGFLFGSPGNGIPLAVSQNEFAQIVNGRYGPDTRPGVPNADDLPLSWIKTRNIPPTYLSLPITDYASPPDVWGRGAIANDYVGQPIFPYPDPGLGYNHVLDDPYELNLSDAGSQDTGGVDTPYTVAELERLLRFNDVDSRTLPSRLLQLAPNTLGNVTNRRSITTHSMHVPVPNLSIPLADRVSDPYLAGAANPHFTDLFAAKLSTIGGLNQNQITSQLQIMLPFEMYRGQLFNINRLLGNGVDDNGNFIADEPFERDGGEQMWGSVPFNYGNGVDPFITQARFAPQIYARHLYCLMMLLADQGYVHPVTPQEAAQAGWNGVKQQELTARRIAQWAINVVDYRDSDSIMTPFEYDVNPWNGWGIDGSGNLLPLDGNPGTDELTLGSNPERRIVWGCEFPDVLITETHSFHDRRVKDTELDNDKHKKVGGGAMDDDDVDQFRIPQGSLFVELYCPKNSNNVLYPRELYNGANRLNLAGRSPPSPVDGVLHPIWQLAISENHLDTDGNAPLNRAQNFPDSTSFQPENMTVYPSTIQAAAPLTIERWVWFSAPLMNDNNAVDVQGNNMAVKTYYNSSGAAAALLPGQYAVVGPRTVTTLGSRVPADPATTHYDGPALQKITLNPGAVGYNDITGAGIAAQIQPAIGIVVDANTPTNTPMPWDPMNARRVGLSVTEPLPQSANYYKEPNWAINPDGMSEGFYDDPSTLNNTDRLFPDEPFDSQVGRPLRDHNMLASQTYLNRNSVFLQRLANPLEGWHPATNPYITVDWASIDTTVFTGEDDTSATNIDPHDPMGARDQFRVKTRERGELVGNVPNGNLWNPLTAAPPQTMNPGPGAGTYYFTYNFINTLSYLNFNVSGGSMLTSPPYPAGYAGSPASPFPTLCWLNRPFASPLELLQVPTTSQGRLLWEFTIDKGADPYDSTVGNTLSFRGPFWHTLNFLHGSRRPTIPSPMPAANNPPPPTGNFHRLFDFIETPSPFVGTERWYNPQVFAGAAVGTSADGFRPPYNRLSRFRDPGRINLNTIFDPQVFSGLMKGYFPQDPSNDGGTFFQNFIQSRQGYNGVGALNANYPTESAGFFSSSTGADLAPAVPNVSLRRDGVEATLLRSDLNNFAQPLLGYMPFPPAEVPYNHSRYNSHARYHPIQRLANLTSTHSNVYAIWITVGQFEVEPIGVNPIHPDGFRLGQEIGIDTGTVKRHRAFYMFDRSIPVAYEPGENHNVDRAVLLKRFIE